MSEMIGSSLAGGLRLPWAWGLRFVGFWKRWRMRRLINGLIAKGEPCPYLDRCGLRTENCPSVEFDNIRTEIEFSCGCARAFDLFQKNKEDAENAAVLAEIVVHYKRDDWTDTSHHVKQVFGMAEAMDFGEFHLKTRLFAVKAEVYYDGVRIATFEDYNG
jgi:hypothetical protein